MNTSIRRYLTALSFVCGAMLVGILIAIDFRSDPFACAATGGVVALASVAYETYAARARYDR